MRDRWLSENSVNDRRTIGLVSKEWFVLLDYLETPIDIPRQTVSASLILSLQSKRTFLAIFQQRSLNFAVIIRKEVALTENAFFPNGGQLQHFLHTEANVASGHIFPSEWRASQFPIRPCICSNLDFISPLIDVQNSRSCQKSKRPQCRNSGATQTSDEANANELFLTNNLLIPTAPCLNYFCVPGGLTDRRRIEDDWAVLPLTLAAFPGTLRHRAAISINFPFTVPPN